MENITSSADLKNEIQFLENEQAIYLLQIREKFFIAYESLKPANLIQSTLKEVASSPYLVDNILSALLGLATGYLSKKTILKESDSKVRKLIGTVLQIGITNLIALNPETIKSVGQFVFKYIFSRKMNKIKQ